MARMKLIRRAVDPPVFTMFAYGSLFRLCVVVVATMSASSAQQVPPVRPDLRSHRADIRRALLQATPLGSSAENVLRIIKKDLQKEGDPTLRLENHSVQTEGAANSAKCGVKSIHLRLGDYIYNPAVIFLSAPMPLQKEVTADWAFNKDDRLIELFVDKKTATY